MMETKQCDTHYGDKNNSHTSNIPPSSTKYISSPNESAQNQADLISSSNKSPPNQPDHGPHKAPHNQTPETEHDPEPQNVFASIQHLHNVPIKVVANQDALKLVVDELLSYNPSFLSIDCEWKSQRIKGRAQNKVSVVQIAHECLIIVIQLHHFRRAYHALFTSGMLDILKDPKIIKCGVGVNGDATKMYRDHQVRIRGCIELNHVNLCPIRSNRPQVYLSLEKLCRKVLQCPMQYKSKKITLSNWENETLSEQQILYAADDAFKGYCILDRMLKSNHQTGSWQTVLRHIHDYTDRRLVDQALEQFRDNMMNIARRYASFELHELCDIYFNVFGWRMKRKYQRRIKELVHYFY
eukprot:526646_1